MPTYPAAAAHGPIELIANDVFWVRGSIGLGPGLRITRNMVIVRSGDTLTLIHAVRLSPEGEAELHKLGTVKNVVKAAHAHGQDDAYYLDKFDATYWALPKGARDQDPKVQQELSDENLPFDDAKLFEFREPKRRRPSFSSNVAMASSSPATRSNTGRTLPDALFPQNSLSGSWAFSSTAPKSDLHGAKR